MNDAQQIVRRAVYRDGIPPKVDAAPEPEAAPVPVRVPSKKRWRKLSARLDAWDKAGANPEEFPFTPDELEEFCLGFDRYVMSSEQMRALSKPQHTPGICAIQMRHCRQRQSETVPSPSLRRWLEIRDKAQRFTDDKSGSAPDTTEDEDAELYAAPDRWWAIPDGVTADQIEAEANQRAIAAFLRAEAASEAPPRQRENVDQDPAFSVFALLGLILTIVWVVSERSGW